MDGGDLLLTQFLRKLKISGQLYELDLNLLVVNSTPPIEKMCLCLLVTSISFAVGSIVPDRCRGRECHWSKLWEESVLNRTTVMYILDTVLEEFTELGLENRCLLEDTILTAIGEAKNGTLSGSLGSLLLRNLMARS